MRLCTLGPRRGCGNVGPVTSGLNFIWDPLRWGLSLLGQFLPGSWPSCALGWSLRSCWAANPGGRGLVTDASPAAGLWCSEAHSLFDCLSLRDLLALE